jgi:hypothetical protein
MTSSPSARRSQASSQRGALLLALAASFLSLTAEAQVKPLVASHPLEFIRSPPDVTVKQTATLQAEFERAVREAGADSPNSFALDSAFTNLKRKDCALANDCLASFAQKASSLYGLHVSVDVDIKEMIILTGRVVRNDGVLMAGPKTVSQALKKEPFPKGVKWLMTKLLKEELLIGDLPSVRSVEVKPLPTPVVDAGVMTTPDAGVQITPEQPVDAGVLPPPPPPPQLESPLRSAGLITAITGGGVAVLGGALFTAGRLDAGKYFDENGFLKSAAGASNARGALTMQAVGVTLGIVGVAAAGAGFVMWLMGAPPEKTSIFVAPDRGGAMIGISGELP